jgi:RNA polymerase sigma-70 factor (ECF subfamily)
MDAARHEQFAAAFVRCQDRVYGYIVTMLPNRHDAEDVFQQTSLILWRKWDQFEPPARHNNKSTESDEATASPFTDAEFIAWACGIARYEVRNFLRRRGRERVVLSEQMMSELADVRLEAQPALQQRRGLLAECVEKLDFLAREMLQRCYAGREPIKLIAQQFRTTPNAIHLRLRRIRRELLECIERGSSMEDMP